MKLTTALLTLASILGAQENHLARYGESRASTEAKPRAVQPGASHRSVLLRNSTVQPGSYVDTGEIGTDFSGSEYVAISIASPWSLDGLTILVEWSSPGEVFLVTDFIDASKFSRATGGVRVPVYGPAMRIVLANDGKAPVVVKQLAVYVAGN